MYSKFKKKLRYLEFQWFSKFRYKWTFQSLDFLGISLLHNVTLLMSKEETPNQMLRKYIIGKSIGKF
jgi:hypothetical protein